jgi:hypothetical protein
MKRIALLLVIILGSATLYAQEQPKGMEMTGTICDSKCVTQSAGQSACDLKCTQTGGDAVFVEDNGKVTKIANPDKVKGSMGMGCFFRSPGGARFSVNFGTAPLVNQRCRRSSTRRP